MNKLLKGSIAAAAGVALLMGGAGTFAYWNASSSIGSGTIVAGDLKVTPGAAGVWANQVGTINIATYKIVPGDILTFTQTVNLVATGNTLKANVALAAGSITATTAAAADTALAGYLTNTTTVALTAGSGVTGTAPNYSIIGTAAGETYPAVVKATINFPFNAAATTNNDSKLGSVNLTNLALSVTQVTTTP